MTHPEHSEHPQPESNAAANTNALALDKETLKDLDAHVDQIAAAKGGATATFIVCLSVECWTR